MPITLGILAQARIAPPAAGSFDLIETVSLSSNAASVSFSNLNNFASIYRHLQIRMVARMATGSTATWQLMTFNGVGGTSYASHGLVGNGSSVASQAQTSASSMRIGFIDGDQFTASVIDVLDAYQTKNKTVRSLVGAHGFAKEIHLRSGLFNSTASITSLTLAPDGANFLSGSRFSLYGIKG